MKTLRLLLALMICGVLFAGPALAVIFQYIDANGRLVFVDDESKIPSQYREKTEPIRERTDELTAEELEAYRARQAEERTERALRRQAQQEAKFEEQQRDYQTPVMVRGNRVMVPVEVAHRNRVIHVFLLLDTGASRTVIHRSSLDALGLPAGEKIQAQIAGGRSMPSEKVKVRYLEVGPFREKNPEVMLIDPVRSSLPFDGMLGNDFLRNHPYEIDYEREIISWKMSG